MPAARIVLELIADFVAYLDLLVRRRKAIAERKVDPRRIDGCAMPIDRNDLSNHLFGIRDLDLSEDP